MDDLEYRPSYSSSDAEMEKKRFSRGWWFKPRTPVRALTVEEDMTINGERYFNLEALRDLVLLMARKEMGNAYVNWAAEDYSAFKRLCIKLGAEWGWPA